MNKKEIGSIVVILLVILLAIGISFTGSQNGLIADGYSIFGLGVALAFLIQWIVFIPSFLLKTEKYFDLTGSITYTLIAIGSLLLSEKKDARSILLTTLIVIWAIRLGSFLFVRIMKAGEDRRFREMKKSFSRFLLTWTIQGLWVTLSIAAALAAITSIKSVEIGVLAIIGGLLWIFGFGVEVIADLQKSRFKANQNNKDDFIRSGLWAWSRHPNYFGEIVLWFGIAIIAYPVLQGWQYLTLISPVFVFILLTKISGIPILEKRADDKWGGQEDYDQYKKNTSSLILFPPRSD